MAFTPPQFNVTCDIWNPPHLPFSDLPDVEDQECQFYITPKGDGNLTEGPPFTSFPPPLYLRLPAAVTAIWRALWMVECPPASGRYYRAVFKEIVHLGFPNQYLLVILTQADDHGLWITRDTDLTTGGGGASAVGTAALTMTFTPAGNATQSDAAVGDADWDFSFAASGTATHS